MIGEYMTISLTGQRVGLKFGYNSLRQFFKKQETVELFYKRKVDGVLVELLSDIGIAHAMYAGYCNNCYCKNQSPTIDFSYFFQYVEDAMKAADRDEKIVPIVDSFMAAVSQLTEELKNE